MQIFYYMWIMYIICINMQAKYKYNKAIIYWWDMTVKKLIKSLNKMQTVDIVVQIKVCLKTCSLMYVKGFN